MTRFGLIGRRRPSSSGISIPTFDPRHPTTVVGVVRLTPSQNKHGFVTPPIGVACAADVMTAPRLVLVDNPLLGLRLAQAGVVGVAIVEDSAALLPLTDWLQARDVVTITTAKTGTMPLPVGITPVGTGRIMGLLDQTSDEVLRLVGLDPVQIRDQSRLPKPPLTSLLLTELHRYASGRVAAGIAADALRRLDADHPDVVRFYNLGYLPTDYQNALSSTAKRALGGLRLSQAVVVPALDEQNLIVDFLVVYVRMPRSRLAGCFSEPRGLVGAGVLGTTDQIIVTDTFRWLARLVTQGYRNVILLRGPGDAAQNATRIAAAGVRSATVRCRREGHAISAALKVVGLQVTVEIGKITGDDWVTAETEVEKIAETQIASASEIESEPSEPAVEPTVT